MKRFEVTPKKAIMDPLFNIEQLIVGFYIVQSGARAKRDCITFVKNNCKLHGPEYSDAAFETAWHALIQRGWFKSDWRNTGVYAYLDRSRFEEYKDFPLSEDAAKEAP